MNARDLGEEHAHVWGTHRIRALRNLRDRLDDYSCRNESTWQIQVISRLFNESRRQLILDVRFMLNACHLGITQDKQELPTLFACTVPRATSHAVLHTTSSSAFQAPTLHHATILVICRC